MHSLSFWPRERSFDEALKESSVDDDVKRICLIKSHVHPRDVYISTTECGEVTGANLINLAINYVETGGTIMEEVYMTEIQLKRILVVDRTNQEQGNQLGWDEIMIKDGVSISKFSKEAMGLGKEVYAEEGNVPTILKKVYILYDKYVGPDSAFPISNWAPRIMTKDRPYSYELQPEYASKAMDWTGKIATAHVIRGFIRGTRYGKMWLGTMYRGLSLHPNSPQGKLRMTQIMDFASALKL